MPSLEPSLLTHKVVFQRGYVSKDQKILQKIDDLIEEYFKVRKDFSFYCDLLAVAPRSMNKILRLHYKMTFHQLIERRIYTEAVNLLVGSTDSVKEIAFELDLEPANFTRRFKELTKYAPLEFRNIYRLRQSINEL
jgi:AraC family transcriptional activator of pobA